MKGNLKMSAENQQMVIKYLEKLEAEKKKKKKNEELDNKSLK